MANTFATKLHIDNHRLSALLGTLLCQPPKARELEGLVLWHLVHTGT